MTEAQASSTPRPTTSSSTIFTARRRRYLADKPTTGDLIARWLMVPTVRAKVGNRFTFQDDARRRVTGRSGARCWRSFRTDASPIRGRRTSRQFRLRIAA